MNRPTPPQPAPPQPDPPGPRPRNVGGRPAGRVQWRVDQIRTRPMTGQEHRAAVAALAALIVTWWEATDPTSTPPAGPDHPDRRHGTANPERRAA